MSKRCFIAINLSQEIKDYLFFLTTELKRRNPSPMIKWVKKEALHITLHFLGYLEEEKIKKVIEKLELKAKGLKPVVLEIGGIGSFPNLKKPRVIFIEAKEIGDRKLDEFQKDLGQELQKLGIEIDKRAWQPHITLARIKSPISNFKFPKQEIKKLRFLIKNIDLMESILKKEGPEYILIKSINLLTN